MKRINTDKLVDAYKADQENLDSKVANAEAEIRAKLAPYLETGTFTEQDVKPLADKLVDAERAEFDKKWAPLADFVEDIEAVAEESTIPSYDPAIDLLQPESVEPNDDGQAETPDEQEQENY